MAESDIPPQTEPVCIILAEDDEGHATLVRRNLARAGSVSEIIRVRDGQELVELLLTPGATSPQVPQGHLIILLDLNMPRMGGVEALRRLRAAPRTAQIPVIMLTTTDDPREIGECYKLGCNAYITKPVSYEAFTESVRRLGLFLQVLKIPKTAPNQASG